MAWPPEMGKTARVVFRTPVPTLMERPIVTLQLKRKLSPGGVGAAVSSGDDDDVWACEPRAAKSSRE